jgi:hypothetical protein
VLHQAQGVVQAGARREVCSPDSHNARSLDSHNARSLHCSQGTLFTTMHAPCVQQVGSGQSRLRRGSSHWGAPRRAWRRWRASCHLAAQRPERARAHGPPCGPTGPLRSWRGWMKVCGASGILRLREVLRHIQKNPHKKTHQLRLSGPSAARVCRHSILRRHLARRIARDITRHRRSLLESLGQFGTSPAGCDIRLRHRRPPHAAHHRALPPLHPPPPRHRQRPHLHRPPSCAQVPDGIRCADGHCIHLHDRAL